MVFTFVILPVARPCRGVLMRLVVFILEGIHLMFLKNRVRALRVGMDWVSKRIFKVGAILNGVRFLKGSLRRGLGAVFGRRLIVLVVVQELK